MRVTQHPTPADLARFLVARDGDDPRVRAVRVHLVEYGCGACLGEVRRLAGSGCEEETETVQSVPKEWFLPRKICLASAGYRGLGGGDLQLMCRAGNFELDVVVRMRGTPAHLEIVGQVTHASRVYEPVANLTLKLVEARAPAPVMSTSTDSFGEFDFMSLEEATYGIRLGASNDAPTVLVWDNGQC